MNIDNIDELLGDYNLTKVLKKIDCPTLIIQADPNLGGMLSDEDVEKMIALIPNSVHVKLKKIGHSLHLMDGKTLFLAINEFLSKLD